MSDTNNNFDDLKRLLKLKQQEVPPPGYFHHFSGDVMSRIRAGETGGAEGLWERLQAGSPLFMGVFKMFENKPGVIGGLATSLCLVLLIGVVLADRPENVSAASNLITSQPGSDAAPTLASTAALMPASDNSGITISTNPVASLQPVATLFGGTQNPLFQNASFTINH